MWPGRLYLARIRILLSAVGAIPLAALSTEQKCKLPPFHLETLHGRSLESKNHFKRLVTGRMTEDLISF
jgi:hypothetical protein